MPTVAFAAAPFYAEAFGGFVATLRRLGVNGVSLRERALARLDAAAFAVAGREEWKYGDPAPFLEAGFRPRADLVRAEVVPPPLPGLPDSWRLVFLNGRFQASWSSSLALLPAGVRMGPLAEAGGSPELGGVAALADSPLTILNTVFWQDGLRLRLLPDTRLDRPLELLFVTDERADGALIAPRNLIIAGAGSGATVIERHLSLGRPTALAAGVTEVICEPGADLRHLKWLGESDTMLHYGSTHVRQAADSSYTSREFLLGGSRIRRELHVELADRGAGCDLSGLTLLGGGQRGDVRTRVVHAAAGCRTEELFKGIFAGESRGVFDGLIKVARDAQQTRAFQSNRNLLLGEDARSHSIPRLEIYADDVKCSHGSTTGRLDPDQLFYLRSRGFDEAAARDLLASAFASEVVEAVEVAGLRAELAAAVQERLAAGRQGDRS